MAKTLIVGIGIVGLIVASVVLVEAKEAKQISKPGDSTIGPYALSADHISYDPRTQTLRLKGNAKIASDKCSIAADTIVIYLGEKNNLRIQVDGITAQVAPTLTELGNGVAVPTKSITDYAEQHKISFEEARILIRKESEMILFPPPRPYKIGDAPENGIHIEPTPSKEKIHPR